MSLFSRRHGPEVQAFNAAFKAANSATPRAERTADEAWVFDSLNDADICLWREIVQGSLGRTVFVHNTDYTMEMAVALEPPVAGHGFRHYTKGLDDTRFTPTEGVTQAQIRGRFMEMVGHAQAVITT